MDYCSLYDPKAVLMIYQQAFPMGPNLINFLFGLQPHESTLWLVARFGLKLKVLQLKIIILVT